MMKLAALALTGFAVLFSPGVDAGEMDWTMRLTRNNVAVAVADEAAKRNVGVMDISGPAEIAGAPADVTSLVLFDYANGTGPWHLYMTAAFSDGSLTLYGSGMTIADENGLNSRFEGPLVVIAATGRFAGTRGGGTMTGQRAGTVGEDIQIDYKISLKLSD